MGIEGSKRRIVFESLNFDLEPLFDRRLMRSKIANNKRLQPDYFAFDKQAGLKLIEEHKYSESEFADIYAKFIGVFAALREQLNAAGLSSQNCQEVVKSAISHCLIEGQ